MDSPVQHLENTVGQKPNEHCAVVGFYGTDSAFDWIYTSLRTLQHRGQESSGVAIFDGSKINVVRVMGLVNEGFKNLVENGSIYSKLNGNIGVGHNRYSTAGSKDLSGAGPVTVSSMIGELALSHNGEIVNQGELREELKKKGVTFQTQLDTEVLLMVLSREIGEKGVKNGFKNAISLLKGAYSCALLINDKLYAFRDPLGIRPLIFGQVGNHYVVASESSVLDVLGGKIIRDVEPGEVIEFSETGFKVILNSPSLRTAHCMFEYVYFSRPDSVIDGVEVYNTRILMGRQLAKEAPVAADVVVPVPDSGRTQAMGYAMELGIEYSEGLFKNRYSERTFIMPSQSLRSNSVKLKLNPIKSVIAGKKVVLIDDSIVRGTTMRYIVSILRNAGASEIHVRIGSPMIVAPCYLGVDMKTRDQFIAINKSVSEINLEIGSNSLAYLSLGGLKESIGLGNRNLCLGCLTGEYPVKIQGEKYIKQTALESY
ncbi:MAG: amidophosphoribosyltransferase [Thermoplasmataceae archaeon]